MIKLPIFTIKKGCKPTSYQKLISLQPLLYILILLFNLYDEYINNTIDNNAAPTIKIGRLISSPNKPNSPAPKPSLTLSTTAWLPFVLSRIVWYDGSSNIPLTQIVIWLNGIIEDTLLKNCGDSLDSGIYIPETNPIKLPKIPETAPKALIDLINVVSKIINDVDISTNNNIIGIIVITILNEKNMPVTSPKTITARTQNTNDNTKVIKSDAT